MTATPPTAMSFGARLTELAGRLGDAPALVVVDPEGAETTLGWRALEAEANRTARLLAAHGVGSGAMLVLALPNGLEHYLVTLAGWKLGACVLPLNAAAPPAERDALVGLAAPMLVVAEDAPAGAPTLPRDALDARRDLSPEPLPDRVPHPGKAIGSGGSTGRPKIIVDPNPWAAVPGAFTAGIGGAVGMRSGQVQLVAGPLHFNAPFHWSHFGLFEAQTLVVMQRFRAPLFVDLVERHGVGFAFVVPTMMGRILELPDLDRRGLASLESVFHSGGPCPPHVKRAWIDLVGPRRVFEGFGATEGVGLTIIRGDDWLERPGSVGRGVVTEVRILDDDRRPVPAGDVGEIFMRRTDTDAPTYRYIGAPPAETTADGFTTVGDLGRLDADGWLYPADRRADLILSGGANVYPAEVEAALTSHPAVRDAIVLGLPDPRWEQRVHAVIEPADRAAPPDPGDLDRHCRARLAAYKVPKTWELVDRLPRDAAGKIRRRAMALARQQDGCDPTEL